MSIKINDAKLVFKNAQRERSSTTKLILHHSGVAVLQSVQVIHDYYLNRVDPDGSTYIGIGYHYYVRKDGSIWRGREERAIGGHAGSTNSISIGICFEGNFEVEQMGTAQLAAGQALIADILIRYPELTIQQHKEVSATSCPGAFFPFDQLTHLEVKAAVQPVPFPGSQFFGSGKSNDFILMLDKALIAKGYGKYYKKGVSGASRSWGSGTQKACQAFQKAQGWKGSSADGIPGPETWKRLEIHK